MDGIGLRGSNEQLNAKKAIVASCAKLDPTNNKLQNEKLLKALLHHKSCSGKTKFVKSCTERGAKFEATGDAKAFCHEEKTQQKEEEEEVVVIDEEALYLWKEEEGQLLQEPDDIFALYMID